jgi:hypothetical protein
MELLYLDFLGPLQIRLGEQSLTGFTTMKALALLVYLAVTPGVHSRDTLANLLWSDMPDQQAKKIYAMRYPTCGLWWARICSLRAIPWRLIVPVPIVWT